MKHLYHKLAAVLFACGLLSCHNETPHVEPVTAPHTIADTASVAAPGGATDTIEKSALKRLFNGLQKGATLKDNEIRTADGSSVRLKLAVTFDGARQGQWIYAAGLTTTYTAKTAATFTIEVIGVGKDRQEAADVCIQEWLASFGLPFADMLNDHNALNIGNLKVYPGLMGIRGNMPEGYFTGPDEQLNRSIIAALQPLINATPRNVATVDIKLLIGEDGITDGECRIDNTILPQGLQALKQLKWPPSKEQFIFKQVFLIRKPGA